MFDPSGGEHYGFGLRGERLVDGEYQRMEMQEEADGGIWGHSPTLNLEFHWADGSLRLYDPVGERWLQTSAEMESARQAAERRAQAEENARHESERRARVERAAYEARIAEMEAELRQYRRE